MLLSIPLGDPSYNSKYLILGMRTARNTAGETQSYLYVSLQVHRPHIYGQKEEHEQAQDTDRKERCNANRQQTSTYSEEVIRVNFRCSQK